MDLLQNLFKKKPTGLTSTPTGGRRKKHSKSRSRSRHTRGGKGSGAGTVKGFFGGKGPSALGFSALTGGRRRRGTRKSGKGRRRR